MSPAHWEFYFRISSNKSKGYLVHAKYPFSSSFAAVQACPNVADAFAPAVQWLIHKIINHPGFPKLIEG